MRVAMVQIGPMRMIVGQGVVAVPMGMPMRRRQIRMRMGMMIIIVTMLMGVFHGFMDMPMAMPIPDQEESTRPLQAQGDPMISRQGLAQPKRGKGQAEERRRSEDHLAAARAQRLCRPDVENDAGAVGHGSQGQSAADRPRRNAFGTR